jgi:hypothetical protein
MGPAGLKCIDHVTRFPCSQVRRYQEELASLQNVVKQTPNSYRQARRDLTGNPAGSSADAQRQKLLDSTSTLNKTGQRLTESRQLLAGMEVSHSDDSTSVPMETSI